MKVRFKILHIITFALILITSASCVHTPSSQEIRVIDSINQRAYDLRYKQLNLSYREAMNAYHKSASYDLGKAEACNTLGFCAFMRMDFDAAERCYKEVYKTTQNELELVIADIGLMKIYQRTSMNKEYYDCRNSALRRLKRINEDQSVFVDVHEKKRLNYAHSEFNIVSSIYYYYLQQENEAIQSINQVKDIDLVGDTAQTLYYYYIKGSAELFEKSDAEQKNVNEFDELYRCWQQSRNRFIYFEANSLQGVASLLNNDDIFTQIYRNRPQALQQINRYYMFQKSDITPNDTTLSLNLSRSALQKFKAYKDIYQIAGAYVSIGKYYNIHGRYSEALDTLTQALNCVNTHHKIYYSKVKKCTDKLRPFELQDTIYTELGWINDKEIKTVPEWIARIREQLSVTYAGLEMKVPSNYNRNIYLDILDFTRQDKELESRSQELENEDRQLNILSAFVFSGILLIIILFLRLNARSKARSRSHTKRLRSTLEICKQITASIPADVGTTDEIINSVATVIQSDLKQLFDAQYLRIGMYDREEDVFIYPNQDEECEEIEHAVDRFVRSEFLLYLPEDEHPVGMIEIFTRNKMTKESKALMNVITPYIAWTLGNGLTFITLGDERKRLEKQRYVCEQHIAENKRQNLVKKSCMAIVYGITPYLDRIINEVSKLINKGYLEDESIKYDKYQYIDELVTKINEYNDILALWIKMKQGSLNLNIENFELNELFEVIAKGRKTFEMKDQSFDVEPTDAIIKADKALTLFMINTLTENARKYTPKGGTIRVKAVTKEDYVEISVEDTGRGISSDDVTRILGEKVYDSRQIGMDGISTDELAKSKGSGFGLMNCKGIIEKYRKTNDLFKVCSFNIDSELNKGSRFYFRLPIGVRKMLGILICIFLCTGVTSCDKVQKSSAKDAHFPKEKVAKLGSGYDKLLNEASLFADTVYYCNVIENYPLALQYADSAIAKLNQFYIQNEGGTPRSLMSLTGKGKSAEITWWNSRTYSDYYIILDIRNEAAVAFLALKQWDNYQYNNTAYSRLYKLVSEDSSLEEYCRNLEHSTNNKVVAVILCIALLLLFFVGYYLLYVRKRLINRWNLEQVLDINNQVLASSLTLNDIPRQVVDHCFEGINELLTIDMLCIGVYNEESHQLEFAYNPHQAEWSGSLSDSIDKHETLTDIMQRCFDSQSYVNGTLDKLLIYGTDLLNISVQTLPLMVEVGDTHRCVGVLAFLRQEGNEQEEDHLLIELISSYVAIVVFNAAVKLATKYRDIESAEEDTLRASWEDSLLHVQNMVLDNCLSTIKHETIYYPNKIKQIIDKLNKQRLNAADEREQIETVSQLVDYYKGIFTILSSCAARQLEEVTFRRTTVDTNSLLQSAEKYFLRMSKRQSNQVSLQTEACGVKVIGDDVQLKFLFENLINESLSVPLDGIISIKVQVNEDFVRFLYTDHRRNKDVEELNQLFYPDLARMTASEDGELKGTEYLLCKQIIRDHDEFAGRRGCRINAEPAVDGGFTVYFTLPINHKK